MRFSPRNNSRSTEEGIQRLPFGSWIRRFITPNLKSFPRTRRKRNSFRLKGNKSVHISRARKNIPFSSPHSICRAIASSEIRVYAYIIHTHALVIVI